MNEVMGRYAIITGNARGIGADILYSFAENGITGVVVVDIEFDGARFIAQDVGRRTVCKCIPIKANKNYGIPFAKL